MPRTFQNNIAMTLFSRHTRHSLLWHTIASENPLFRLFLGLQRDWWVQVSDYVWTPSNVISKLTYWWLYCQMWAIAELIMKKAFYLSKLGCLNILHPWCLGTQSLKFSYNLTLKSFINILWILFIVPEVVTSFERPGSCSSNILIRSLLNSAVHFLWQMTKVQSPHKIRWVPSISHHLLYFSKRSVSSLIDIL